MIAAAAVGTPRQALRCLLRARDLAVAHVRQVVTKADAAEALRTLGLDQRGLGPSHQRALRILRYRGRPIGSARLAACVGQRRATFQQTLEPDLLRLGLVSITPRGLVADW